MLRIGARAGLDVVDDASCSSVCLRAERAMERGADVGFGVQMLVVKILLKTPFKFYGEM